MRGLFVWLAIIAAETIHGILRGLFIAPVLGDVRARQIGVLVGSLLVFIIALLSARWLESSSKQLLTIGAIWVGLTVLFEIGLGLAVGLSWERIRSDYDIRAGGMMIFGLLFMLFAPYLASKLRGII